MIATDPSYTEPAEAVATWIAEARQALQARRPADAIAPLTAAARHRPADGPLHHDLGLALLETGHLADAIAVLGHAADVDPRAADTRFRLGIALEQAGDLRAALVAYDAATTLDPTLTEAWFRAGALAHMMGLRDEAIGCFRRAADTGHRTRFGRLGAARALLTEERDDDAERVLRKAIAVDPDNAMAHDLLGNLLAERGRFDEAGACFLAAVDRAPLLAGSYYDLVRCRPQTADDRPLQTRMQAALDTPGLDAGQRQRVHLALGKLADDLGDPAEAMRHFDAADALRPGSVSFDADAFDAEIDRLIACFTPALSASVAVDRGRADPLPVLIVGMPRSGTTLVEQILSSHPDVRGGGELNYWNERGAEWRRTLAPADGADPRDDAAAIEALAAFLRPASMHYLRLLRGIGRSAARVTDKMPFNFLWAGLIHLACPGAVIVHCRRAPIDTALSIHQTLFHPGLAFPTGGTALVRYFRSYERLTAHWRRALPADRFVEVDYERLTDTPEPEIRRLVDACGLPWRDACLTPHRNPRAVRTPSKWQTRQPIHRQSVQRWRRYEAVLGPLAALLDAPPQKSGD